MSLRDQRNKTREAILEGRFITQVLQRNAGELDADISGRISGFASPFWTERNFSVNENVITYTHKRGHRFVDMKTRVTATGNRRKGFHNVHNRPVYGHANEIIRDLTVGYTDAVRAEMEKLDGQQI